jgi:DNA-binding CsgD family transcriptional regulator
VSARILDGLATLADAVESSGDGLIALDAAGHPRHATAMAERLIRKYLGRPLRFRSSLPEQLRAWVDGQAAWLDVSDDAEAPADALVVAHEGLHCLIRWIPADNGSYLLLEERADSPAGEAKRSASLSSLSPREREVLQQVAAGHTNRQIADQLNCSRRTVQKHLEHIFRILRVSNRTAAAIAFHRTVNVAHTARPPG